MGNNYFLYIHITPSNKVYIGITRQEPKKRWKYGYGYTQNVAFYNAIKKYGWKNIIHQILFENLSREEAIQKEIELIERYNSTNKKYGYNITKGGDGTLGQIMSQETRNKISQAKKGHIVTEETRQKIREKVSGEKHHNYNKKLPLEVREKISQAHKGMKFSDEHKKNLSISHKGKTPCNKGKNISETTRQKIIESRTKKALYCINTSKIYNSLAEASKDLNISKTHISDVCNGKRKSTKGYSFKFIKEVA